jgi:hypothetical protein
MNYGNAWLVELEGLRGDVGFTELQLDAIVRDMRLLGLQPTLPGLNDAGASAE